VGCLGLSGFPLVTGGFFSKEAILDGVASRSMLLWVGAVLGVALTSLYTFRMLILAFLGPREPTVHRLPALSTQVAQALLAILSVMALLLGLPEALGEGAWRRVPTLTAFLEPSLGSTALANAVPVEEGVLALVVSLVSIAGLIVAWRLFNRPGP